MPAGCCSNHCTHPLFFVNSSKPSLQKKSRFLVMVALKPLLKIEGPSLARTLPQSFSTPPQPGPIPFQRKGLLAARLLRFPERQAIDPKKKRFPIQAITSRCRRAKAARCRHWRGSDQRLGLWTNQLPGAVCSNQKSDLAALRLQCSSWEAVSFSPAVLASPSQPVRTAADRAPAASAVKAFGFADEASGPATKRGPSPRSRARPRKSSRTLPFDQLAASFGGQPPRGRPSRLPAAGRARQPAARRRFKAIAPWRPSGSSSRVPVVSPKREGFLLVGPARCRGLDGSIQICNSRQGTAPRLDSACEPRRCRPPHALHLKTPPATSRRCAIESLLAWLALQHQR